MDAIKVGRELAPGPKLQFIMNGTAGQASKFGFTLLIKTLKSLVFILFGVGTNFCFYFFR